MHSDVDSFDDCHSAIFVKIKNIKGCLLSDLYAFLDPPCKNIAFFLNYFTCLPINNRSCSSTLGSWFVMDYNGAFAHAKHNAAEHLALG